MYGTECIEAAQLPEESLMRVKLVLDICEAKVTGAGGGSIGRAMEFISSLFKRGGKHGTADIGNSGAGTDSKRGADVVVKSAVGKKSRISRHKLLEKYRLVGGKKIKLSAWQRNRYYTVIKAVKQGGVDMYALYIPKGAGNNGSVQVVINGKTAAGMYIIVPPYDDGSPNMEMASAVTPEKFRRMFCIVSDSPAMHRYKVEHKEEIAERMKLKHEAEQKSEQADAEMREKIKQQRRDERLEQRRKKEAENQKSGYLGKKAGEDAVKDGSMERFKKGSPEKGKLLATGAVVNSDKKVTGFVLYDGRNVKKVAYSDVLNVCRNGLIENMRVDTDLKGEYLVGVGMKIADLPKTTL